jgi:hypothetical protein
MTDKSLMSVLNRYFPRKSKTHVNPQSVVAGKNTQPPDKSEILSLLRKHFMVSGPAHVNAKGVVDVDGDVLLEFNLKQLPVQFGHVTGSFRCYQNKLQSLVGAPQKVSGIFNVRNNQLTHLQGGPTQVGGDYNVAGNHLTSLAGAPESVGGRFFITYYPDTPLLKLFNYKHVQFILPPTGPRAVPQIWVDLFNPEKHPELQGGGRAAQIKAVAMLTKAGLYKNNPNAQL